MFVSVNLRISLCMFTVSNALLMSKATATVRCEGLGLFEAFCDLVRNIVQSSVLSVYV